MRGKCSHAICIFVAFCLDEQNMEGTNAKTNSYCTLFLTVDQTQLQRKMPET